MTPANRFLNADRRDGVAAAQRRRPEPGYLVSVFVVIDRAIKTGPPLTAPRHFSVASAERIPKTSCCGYSTTISSK
jgi:hypothetical protein